MHLTTIPMTPFETNAYVIADGDEALIVDPGDISPRLREAIAGKRVVAIVNTHGHCDHCGGNAAVVRETGAELLCHRDDLDLLRSIEIQGRMFGVPFAPSPEPNRFLDDGDTLTVGGQTFTVRHAPGHTQGHIVLVGDGVVFAGDVLFAGSIGRTDLPGGDYHQLLDSIQRVLLSLPDDTVVYCGHGPSTTIGEERRANPFLVMP